MVGRGLPILLKNGAIAKQRLIDYVGRLLLERGYVPLATPQIGNLSLFEKSGHYPYYKESMFPLISTSKSDLGIDEKLVLKPMSCPFHIMAYDKLGIVSYKDLPIKFYEFAQVYRYEDSGALNGLYRLRTFTQDDGHIFCTIRQVESLINECIDLIKIICYKFQLGIAVKCSVRTPECGEKYIGLEESWETSEHILETLCRKNFENNYEKDIGGAAFYGPKIDFIAMDKLNRQWQLGTIQLDFSLPQRFGVGYINDQNKKDTPVLIHRALLGSLERFLGVLVENELLPLYLQPFNMGVIWIGTNENYFAQCISILKTIGVYPTIIRFPNNLSEAMSQLYLRDITNITIIGKKEEVNRSVNFNKKSYILTDYAETVKTLFQL